MSLTPTLMESELSASQSCAPTQADDESMDSSSHEAADDDLLDIVAGIDWVPKPPAEPAVLPTEPAVLPTMVGSALVEPSIAVEPTIGLQRVPFSILPDIALGDVSAIWAFGPSHDLLPINDQIYLHDEMCAKRLADDNLGLQGYHCVPTSHKVAIDGIIPVAARSAQIVPSYYMGATKKASKRLEAAESGVLDIVNRRRPAFFKIGYATNPCWRFSLYAREGYNKMVLLDFCTNGEASQLMEAILIRIFDRHRGCRNDARGGEGPRVRHDTPYFVYCVTGDA